MGNAEQYVVTKAVKAAVRGQETSVLDALSIPWEDGGTHINCPYPDHPDENPSWRWDEGNARAHCTCIERTHSIFDVLAEFEGTDFEAAKIRVAEIICRNDLVKSGQRGGRSRFDAETLLNPPSDQRGDDLAIKYLAFRLGVTFDEVPRPTTPFTSWKALGYFDHSPGKGKPKHMGDYPCAVFGTTDADGREHAQRIYLAGDGQGKAKLGKRPVKKAAITNDRTAGCSVIWGDPNSAAKIVLAEGIETAAAIAHVFREEIKTGQLCVAAAVSAKGMEAFRPWPDTKQVIVAADRDEAPKSNGKEGSRRGERAARTFGACHSAKLEVSIALPGSAGETVDWLEILCRDGREAVRKGINAAEPFQPTEEELTTAQQRDCHLSIGSDVEIAHLVARDLSSKHGKVVFSEGFFWRFATTHWISFSASDMRRSVYQYDGFGYGGKGVVRLGKTKIDSILHELAAILDEPDFFADGEIGINCTSGFIEFNNSGEPSLKPHSPDHRRRHVLPGKWPVEIDDITAARSLLSRLLQGSFDGDLDAKQKIDLLSEVAGCAALGYATRLIKPKAIVLKGETAENGKSQVLDILRGLLPKDACTSLPLGKFGDEKYLIQLTGKLLNASDELTSAAAIASDAFKQVVTGEPISARDLYKSTVTFRSVAQHVFATNDLPSFKGGMDRGVQRRLLVLTFNRVIPEGDRIEHIGYRIATEEPDLLLDWAVAGASRLIKQGRFTEPDSSCQSLRDWLLGADPVHAWLEDAVTVVLGQEAPKIQTSAAYTAFREWAVDAGFDEKRLPKVNNFTQRLLAAGKGITKSRDGKARYLVGLSIPRQATSVQRPAANR